MRIFPKQKRILSAFRVHGLYHSVAETTVVRSLGPTCCSPYYGTPIKPGVDSIVHSYTLNPFQTLEPTNMQLAFGLGFGTTSIDVTYTWTP